MTNPSKPAIIRGDIWLVNFDPTIGQEIQKTRPAVVMNIVAGWRMRLHIVIPITSWQTKFAADFWMIYIKSDGKNNLDKDSAANTFQIKSVAEERFSRRLGTLDEIDLDRIATTIGINVGIKFN